MGGRIGGGVWGADWEETHSRRVVVLTLLVEKHSKKQNLGGERTFRLFQFLVFLKGNVPRFLFVVRRLTKEDILKFPQAKAIGGNMHLLFYGD